MKTQIKELDYKYYDMDNMCNSCSNPLPILKKIIVMIGNTKYHSPLCINYLNERGISYDSN
jgi:hypothetical protein